LENFHAVGTDGAPNMCGVKDSFYTHLKERIPHLILIQCICHSIDKCAEYAFKKLDSVLTYILAESHNYLAHSAKRWAEYVEYYKVLISLLMCIIRLYVIRYTYWCCSFQTKNQGASEIATVVRNALARLGASFEARN